jgi:hypothetical protein
LGGKLVFIKVACWIGIIGDFLTCIPLLFPKIAEKMYGLESIAVTGEYLYVTRIAAALMLGWTFLLFWVVLKPLERKGVLLLTLVPVMCGIVIAGIFAVTSGMVPVSNMVPIWIFNGIIVIVFALAYYFATILARKSG